MSLRPLAALLTITLSAQLCACGTLFYPERRGQISGQIDPAIAAMNAIGVLFFVIPGLIAFAVDFSTGAIYMPGSRYSLAPERLQPALQADGQVDLARLQAILAEELQLSLALDHPALQVHQGELPQLARFGLAPRG